MKPTPFIRRLFWGCLFPAFLLTAVYPVRLNGYLNPHDEGLWMGVAQALLEGKKLYRDVFFLYGPLLGLFFTGIVKMLPPTVAAYRAGFWLLNALGLLCLYACLLRWVKSSTLRLVGSFFLFFIPLASPIPTIPMAARYAAGFLPFLFWPTEPFWAGACAAIAYLITPDVGIAALVAGGYYFCLGPHAARGRKSFLTGSIAVLGSAGAWLLCTHSLKPYLDCSFMQTPRIMIAERLSLPTLTHIDWKQPGPWFRPFQFLGMALALYLPALTYVSIFLYAVRCRYLRQSYDRLWIGLALYGAFAGMTAWMHADPWHIYYGLSPALFIWVLLADRTSLKNRPGATLAVITTGILLTLPFYIARQAKDAVFKKFSQSTQIKRAGSTELLPAQAQGYEFLVKWIQSHTREGEGVLFYPYDGNIFFLSNRPSPSFYPVLASATSAELQERVVRDLELSPPNWVIWDTEDTAFQGIPIDQFLFVIHRYIATHYQASGKVGPFQFLKRVPKSTGHH